MDADIADDAPLTRTAASEAVADIGWRYVLNTLAASVPVATTARALDVAAAAVQACGSDADAHLRADVRPDRVELSLATRARSAVTGRDVDLAHAVAGALDGLGLSVAAPTSQPGRRPVQTLEIAIDALDIASVRPFWAAVLGLVGTDGAGGWEGDLVDPVSQLPNVWFQQMSGPRPQRSRTHLDVHVPLDEAEPRVAATLAAGGRLLDDSHAPSWWVLADPEGNEACVCTWVDLDAGDDARAVWLRRQGALRHAKERLAGRPSVTEEDRAAVLEAMKDESEITPPSAAHDRER